MGIFGPQTTYVLALKDAPGTHEFLLLDEGNGNMSKTQQKLVKGKCFLQGTLGPRSTTLNLPRFLNNHPKQTSILIDFYVREKYTLRYTGGMVPDVSQKQGVKILNT
ncbi:hypothetical protein Leryth_020524 [Lithospermum erythrorhizon]|nr:hypothetical protein Leryth_020524 [Lithospermum erythrorhizon]